ncbi:MAG: C39 family peptidase [Aquificaceae bacterium]|jgi:ABC-type bacteriocin/lantibiotic exporter with double-glycine peptidase domain|uniref:C39 family peptidase n=1 Tax=Hydrogenobacter sp. Uz 6-8 TaxID=3384828 RepID=UPI000F28D892|nr:MAG: peptidase C39 [Aquificota bacterium]
MFLLLLLFPLFLFSKNLDVPFVKQRDQFCGPASLSSVLAYYGVEVSQEEIGQRVYDPKLKGALITDLEKYARERGFKTSLKVSNLQELRDYLKEGIPPIVLVDLGKLWVSLPHYMVVVGYKDETFFVHTGYEASKPISAKELDRVWSKMGRVVLILYPP